MPGKFYSNQCRLLLLILQTVRRGEGARFCCGHSVLAILVIRYCLSTVSHNTVGGVA